MHWQIYDPEVFEHVEERWQTASCFAHGKADKHWVWNAIVTDTIAVSTYQYWQSSTSSCTADCWAENPEKQFTSVYPSVSATDLPHLWPSERVHDHFLQRFQQQTFLCLAIQKELLILVSLSCHPKIICCCFLALINVSLWSFQQFELGTSNWNLLAYCAISALLLCKYLSSLVLKLLTESSLQNLVWANLFYCST